MADRFCPGTYKGRDVTVVDVFEAVGRHAAGTMSDEELHELECVACPSAGACGGQFTANTMAMVSRGDGPGVCLVQPVRRRRMRSATASAVESGRAVMALLAEPHPAARHRHAQGAGERRRDRRRDRRFDQCGLHLPAIAHEAGIRFTMDDVVEIMRRTPYIADLKPGGKYVALDVHKVGGIPVVLKALLDGGLLHGDCLTVTGKTLAENLKDVVFPTDQDVIYPVSKAISNHRRRGRPEGQPGARWSDREGRRHAQAALRGHCAVLRFARKRPSPLCKNAPTRRAT